MGGKLEIKHTNQGIEYHSSYNKALVASLKSKIPQNERSWQPDSKCWLVHPKHKALLDDLSMIHFGKYPDVAGFAKAHNTGPITKLLQIKYISAPKDRGGGDNLSFAMDFDGNWNTVFSESVLREWFECGIGGQQNVSRETLYGVLAVPRTATGLEIKKAYRKMARRYHPDVNHDSDAEEMFKKIGHAYEELSNPLRRRKYDAGLTFVASLENQPTSYDYRDVNFYRPPFRCGLIMAVGKEEVGRFVVEQILQWEPVRNGSFELVTSWDKVTESIVEEWI